MEHDQYPAARPDVHSGAGQWNGGTACGTEESGGGLLSTAPLSVPQTVRPAMPVRGGMTALPDFGPPAVGTLPPGAIANPCCMGSEAAEMLGVLAGFAEEEAADQRQYQALARQAPSWARQSLRELSADCGSHVRTLSAACYLIAGQYWRPTPLSGPVLTGRWCQALRERYHSAACSALNYARAADGTPDPCLRRILQQLSREEYHQADVLMGLLERTL